MIPRIFHRIWLGARPRPARYDEYWQKWMNLHPDAEFHTWTEENLPELANQALCDRIKDVAKSGGVRMSHGRAVAVQQADVIAYELVRQFGGIYLNCDMLPLKPLDELLEYRAFIGMEDRNFACNAVMAAEPNHPMFHALVDRLPQRFGQLWNNGMEVATGPHHLTDVWRSQRWDVEVLPVNAFYPVHHSEIPYGTDTFDSYFAIAQEKDAYAVHMWGHRSQEGMLFN